MKRQVQEILKRLDRLEKAVLPPKAKDAPARPTKEIFSGPKGGILLLASKGFFSKKREARVVLQELEKHDYHYRIQVVQTALNRLSGTKGVLTAFKEAGHKVYVKRK